MRDRKRVARLVRLRQRLEDQRRGATLRAAHAERAAEAECLQAGRDLSRAGQALTSPGAVAAAELVIRAAAVSWAQRELGEAEARVRVRAGERELAQRELSEAQRERKAVERVAEQLEELRAARIAKVEQEANDDAGARLRDERRREDRLREDARHERPTPRRRGRPGLDPEEQR